ncbi:MAG: 50S ribosomal protein L40e [Candidatus Hodarchaeales archaeon]
MPIDDPDKRDIVKAALLEVAICRKCYARNPLTRKNCRRCGSTRLRPKNKERAG